MTSTEAKQLLEHFVLANGKDGEEHFVDYLLRRHSARQRHAETIYNRVQCASVVRQFTPRRAESMKELRARKWENAVTVEESRLQTVATTPFTCELLPVESTVLSTGLKPNPSESEIIWHTRIPNTRPENNNQPARKSVKEDKSTWEPQQGIRPMVR